MLKNPRGVPRHLQFDINTGEPLSAGTNFSAEFGRFLIDVAEKDRRICAITAAMSVGTGLDGFAAVSRQVL